LLPEHLREMGMAARALDELSCCRAQLITPPVDEIDRISEIRVAQQ
jgi:hypothetical protein